MNDTTIKLSGNMVEIPIEQNKCTHEEWTVEGESVKLVRNNDMQYTESAVCDNCGITGHRGWIIPSEPVWAEREVV